VSLLFDAYAELRSRLDEPPPLVLAGRTTPPDEAWRRAERLGIREAVTMHEDIPLTDLTRLYRAAALYVVSSDEEGLGLTILEAMASGRPVVSTACGGPSTTVRDGETGHLTPVGDASALATAMETILTDPARADAMGRAGRRCVEEHFSAEATGQRFLDEYDRLLDAE
jgi:glycosyltransferase involved in cell wall biosynthesis